jgi:hypothetical protein
MLTDLAVHNRSLHAQLSKMGLKLHSMYTSGCVLGPATLHHTAVLTHK